MDTNLVIASLLRDLASVQSAAQSGWGYKRAAAAILRLEEPIESYREADGSVRKIPHVGPASTRVVREVLETGVSGTVETAVDRSGKRAEVEKARNLRADYLSRARVVAVLKDAALRGPAPADYRGDLQMHSEWSDGADPLERIAEACVARGYSYCAVTDHSYGLAIAGGVSMADMAKQHRRIDALNRRVGGFRMLKGVEANIRPDGRVDLEDDEIRRFEIVVASPHSVLRSAADQTDRMIAAVRRPGVHILGHPRGRMFGTRPGVSADWRLVFEAAAEHGVAVEIDGDPARQDLDFSLAQEAVRSGCLFALDSDAHSVGELTYAETAIAHARLANVRRERVINTWPVERLLAWSEEGIRRAA